jgi:alkanesulfonate monooxygenase SsuD/methylene tetrahydromethanopterin reductase-like flavin-dependent oxidoreductase (luciferase family)
MRFGIMNLFPLAEGQSDRQVIADTLEEIQLADELGFDSVWLAEHHFSRYGILGNPLTFGMAIAERTRRIQIGTAVLVLPFYDPVRLAEDVALLDIISEGRLILGVGRGYQPKEFAGFRVKPEDSHQRYQETLEILRLALAQESWSYDGEIFQFENVTTYPRPLQEGGPTILQGTVSPDSFKTRGEAGEPIITSPNFTPLTLMKRNFDLYREGLKTGGHNFADYEVPFMQQVWTGDGEAGQRQAAQAALNYYRSVGKVIPGSEQALESERRYYEAVHANIKLLTLEQAMTHGGNFGSAQQVAELIADLRGQLGISHYIGWFRIPSLDRLEAMRAMERFATDVMPLVRAAEPTPAT